MFLKIKYILQGYFYWFISLFGKLKNHKLYEKRMNICKECDKNKEGVCEICGCVLKAKTKSDSVCPLEKWK
jgi:hypothetical protein